MFLPHQVRIIAEKADLDEKAKALQNFITRGTIYPTLPSDEQQLLNDQHEIMNQYSAILARRIGLFTSTF